MSKYSKYSECTFFSFLFIRMTNTVNPDRGGNTPSANPVRRYYRREPNRLMDSDPVSTCELFPLLSTINYPNRRYPLLPRNATSLNSTSPSLLLYNDCATNSPLLLPSFQAIHSPILLTTPLHTLSSAPLPSLHFRRRRRRP